VGARHCTTDGRTDGRRSSDGCDGRRRSFPYRESVRCVLETARVGGFTRFNNSERDGVLNATPTKTKTRPMPPPMSTTTASESAGGDGKTTAVAEGGGREFDAAAVRDMGGDKNVFASKACDACRTLGSFMVLVVLGIVGVTYYATVVVVYLPVAREGGDDANLAKAALVIYHVLVFMLLWSYFATVLTDPGEVPTGWTPAPEDEEEAAREAKMSNSERRRRFCKKCAAWKPVRTHHCSVCKRCVLKMDHHCVWVVKCVGAYNYKFFLQFLAYTFLATVLDAILLLSNFIDFFRDVEQSQASGNGGEASRVDPREGTQLAVVFVTFVINVAFSASLLGFLVMHSNLILRNMTTIEMYEKKKTLPWKYDMGKWKNFRQVFGEEVFFWFFPVHSAAHMERMRVITGVTDGECLEGAEYARACEPALRDTRYARR